MLNYDGKIYRNLEEQVKYNAEIIDELNETTVKLNAAILISTDNNISTILSGSISVQTEKMGNVHIPIIIEYQDGNYTVQRVLYFTEYRRIIPRGYPIYQYATPTLTDDVKIVLTATATNTIGVYDYTIQVK